MDTHYKVGHASLLIDNGAPGVEAVTDALIDLRCAVFTTTEIRTPARVKALNERGYGAEAMRGADPGLVYSKARFRALYAQVHQVTSRTYHRATGRRTDPQRALFVVLEDLTTGQRTLWIVNHFPPHVEGSGGPGGIWNRETWNRAVASMSAMSGIKKIRRQLVALFDVEGVCIVGDWNLNIMRAAVRAYFKARFPRMTANFPETYDGRGTLGNRAVDFALVRGLVPLGSPRVQSTQWSNHRFWTQTYRLPRRGK